MTVPARCLRCAVKGALNERLGQEIDAMEIGLDRLGPGVLPLLVMDAVELEQVLVCDSIERHQDGMPAAVTLASYTREGIQRRTYVPATSGAVPERLAALMSAWVGLYQAVAVSSPQQDISQALEQAWKAMRAAGLDIPHPDDIVHGPGGKIDSDDVDDRR